MHKKCQSWQEKLAKTGDLSWDINNRLSCVICGKPANWSGKYVGWSKTCSAACNKTLQNNTRHKKFLQYLHEQEIAKGDLYNRYNDPFAEPPICANPECNNVTHWADSGKNWTNCCCIGCHLSINKQNKHIAFHAKRKQYMLDNNCYNRYNDKFAGPPICIVEGCNNLTKWHRGSLSYAKCCPDCKLTSKYFNGYLHNLQYCINKCSIRYDSSYEYSAIKLFEQLKLKYEHEPISIPYYNANKLRKYMPDFVIWCNDIKIMIEVKPWIQLNNKIIMLKTEAAIKYCKENEYAAFMFMTEDSIYKDGEFVHRLEQLIHKAQPIECTLTN